MWLLIIIGAHRDSGYMYIINRDQPGPLLLMTTLFTANARGPTTAVEMTNCSISNNNWTVRQP